MKEITFRKNEQIDKQAPIKKEYEGNTTGRRENLESRIETI